MGQINALNDQQKEAVLERGKDILVSAPAGSGKTKILVSRIISLIVEDRYHIDQFLVLTFTQAAASEMKQRLVVALEEEMMNANLELLEHLELQKAKLPFAYITNFHGFCNQLLSQYGYLIDVYPGYTIVSETTSLKHETLDQLLERWLKEAKFIEFQNLYFPKGDVNQLKKLLLDIMQVMSAIKDKDSFVEWVQNAVYGFMVENHQDLSKWTIFPKIKEQLLETCIIGLNKIYELKVFCAENEITTFYQQPLLNESKTKKATKTPMEALIDYYQRIINTLQLEDISFDGPSGINEISRQTIEKSVTIPWRDLSDKANTAKTKFSSLRTEINGLYKKKFAEIIETDSNERRMIFSKVKEVIDYIMQEEGLLFQFFKQYKENKQALHLLDFNDLEDYTIELLQPVHQVSALLNEKLKEIMVDEYQDTNMIQESIVSMIAHFKEPYVHYFMVGDMKQSIYRFRQADPEIFKKKYDQYGSRTNDSKKIELVFNYRSNKIVLDSINYIFNQIMDKQIGQLDYYHDQKAQLNYDFLRKEGAKNSLEKDLVTNTASKRIEQLEHLATEVLLLDKSSPTSKEVVDDIEYEAHMVALRIKKMIDEPLMIDQYPDGLRPVDYGDIVVLMRATSGFLTFKKVFDYYQIPNHIILSQGFIDSIEVTNIFSLIKAIKNRYDDVSLLAVLRAPYLFSYFFDFELADIRINNQKQGSIYQNLSNYQEGPLLEKIENFLRVFDALVVKSTKIAFKDWFKLIYEETGYPYFVANQINGEQRYANLSLLYETVMQEQAALSFHDWADLFENWQQHVEHDMPAMLPSSSLRQVSFMTIHKSKGLEFPIVIVANHQKKFNMQDGSARLIVDKNQGMTIKPRIYQNIPIEMFGEKLALQNVVVEYENPYLKILSTIANQETISEEMRIYYVALTRASQKLILTGVIEKEHILDWQRTIIANEEDMPESKDSDHIILYRQARKVKSYLDWLGISLMRHPQIIEQFKNQSYASDCPVEEEFQQKIQEYCQKIEQFNYQRRYHSSNINHSKFKLKLYNYQYIEESKKSKTKKQEKQVLLINPDKMEYYFNYQYPYPSQDRKKSIAVTNLETDSKPVVTTLVAKETIELSASQKGTLIHAFMEFLPFDKAISIQEVIEELHLQGLYNQIEKEVLLAYVDKFEGFRSTFLFDMMAQATLYREKAFSYFDEELQQVVHGIIDALCLYQNKVMVIDYKSDHVSKDSRDEDLIEKHAVQLQYYQKVLKKLYPEYQVTGYIVYLEINRIVEVLIT